MNHIWRKTIEKSHQIYYYLLMSTIAFYGIIKEVFFETHVPFNPKQIKSGGVAVITGGNRGIGLEVVKKLLTCQFHVIIGCRNPEVGNEMILKVRKSGIKTGTAECHQLNLTSLDSVREFAKWVMDKKTPLNLLINNAGIMFAPYALTEDGLESHFQVNYLSHFLLTNLLIKKLHESGNERNYSKVVNVSAGLHYGGKINYKDLQKTECYSAHKGYMDSKLMQIYFSNYFEKRCKMENLFVHHYSLHPSASMTDLLENLDIFQKFFMKLFANKMKAPSAGADCILNAALSPKFKRGGIYIQNSQIVPPKKETTSISKQTMLWKVSSQLVGIDPNRLI